MKKLAKITLFLFLLAIVCYSGFASGIYVATDSEKLGIYTKGHIATFEEVPPGTDIKDYSVTRTNGGVIFQGTAAAEGNAVDQPVTIQYNSTQLNGRRLSLTIGDTVIVPELYDWEILPLARFVESGFAAAMTLYDDRVKPLEAEERDLNERLKNDNKRIFWANFNPALGDTLIGLNLFFVDAMFIRPGTIMDSDTIFKKPIRGYHAAWQAEQDADKEIRVQNMLTIARRLLHEQNVLKSWNSYIYTDDGVDISYRMENGQIVFSGVPAYMFLFNDKANGKVVIADDLNKDIVAMHDDIFALNPTVYRSAEKTAQWAAFFRMVQTDYPQEWQNFIEQIGDKKVFPTVETPRYWLPDEGQK